MLRARPVAGERELGDAFLVELRPFIYPRTPDPRIALELRSMVERSRRALAGDGTRDVKLGRGGIRESEFFVQSLQLIWGGQHRGLQTPSTTRALRALRTAGLLGHRAAMQLGADWALLRRIEHRIHVWTGYQTHALPRAASDLEGFARSLGFEGAAEFEEVLDAARARVSSLFDSLVDGHIESRSDPEIDELIDSVRSGESRDVISRSVALALPVDDPDEATSHLMRARPTLPSVQSARRETPTSRGRFSWRFESPPTRTRRCAISLSFLRDSGRASVTTERWRSNLCSHASS